MSVGRKMQPGSDYFHPFLKGPSMGFIVSVVVSLRCLPLHNMLSYLLKESILRGHSITAVTKLFPNFDPLYPLRGQCWAGILHDTYPLSCDQDWTFN